MSRTLDLLNGHGAALPDPEGKRWLGRRIARRRLEASIGVEQLADAAGVTVADLIAIEKGTTRATRLPVVVWHRLLRTLPPRPARPFSILWCDGWNEKLGEVRGEARWLDYVDLPDLADSFMHFWLVARWLCPPGIVVIVDRDARRCFALETSIALKVQKESS